MNRRTKLARLLLAQPVQIEGWMIELRNGKIHVTNPRGQTSFVDVYNPLKDGELVDFHRRQDVPAAVKQRAEMLASQWRRLIHTTGEWEEMQKNDPPTQLQQFKNTA